MTPPPDDLPQIEVLTGAVPWKVLPNDRGVISNPDFLNFPDWGHPEIRELALQCVKVNPKERPAFGEIVRVLKVRRKGFLDIVRVLEVRWKERIHKDRQSAQSTYMIELWLN